MIEYEPNNDCGVQCPRQRECLRAIAHHMVSIERYEREGFNIEMTWRTSGKEGDVPEVIRLLQRDNAMRIEETQAQIEIHTSELGRVAMLECDGPMLRHDDMDEEELICMGTEATPGDSQTENHAP